MTISPPLRIALIYLLISALWIGVSDRVLNALVPDDQALLTWLQSLKGWAFVVVTALVLYGLIKHDLRRLERANRTLLDGHEQAIRVLVAALDLRHRETGNHSQRVTRVATGLARLAGVDGEALRQLQFGALLHDIGKLAIPDAVLLKAGKLTLEEMELMRAHPQIGRELLEQVDFLRASVDIPAAHHERWDGSGYPAGLKGEQIPLAARIFSIVDVWDALSHARIYKHAWPELDVLSYLRNAAGTQLDPHLVELFLAHYGELKALAEQAEVGSERQSPATARHFLRGRPALAIDEPSD